MSEPEPKPLPPKNPEQRLLEENERLRAEVARLKEIVIRTGWADAHG
jgi:hypothetical protein